MEYATSILSAGERLAAATKKEMELEDGRHAVKMAAVTRIMQSGDNPLTGKPHSFSSAEAMVNSDSEYSAYLGELRQAAFIRMIARSSYDAAVAVAQLAAGKPA